MSSSQESGRLAALRRFPILYGCFWSLLLAAIGIVIVFLLAQYGNLQPRGITAAAYIIHCTAVFFGSISASRCVDSRGWFYGGLTGLLYALLMVAIGIFVYNTFTIDGSGLFRVLLMAVIGAFGGMIGMSTRRDD
ncbi:TIGR04086 family membrane protein [Alicyclobacillus dauci]|uniref:TIGR04086 family membrane protein n=1 Tax=Alicyclobacillus dauci TaxID=1475485 RepID=A0ABY6Z6W9_9BACL|nr:TIGR04086 family membrane protein [Alicyclobacillus dauci]WAH38428.1 TIGR04086 family membrane protein [Alicyclobacillus dauci]